MSARYISRSAFSGYFRNSFFCLTLAVAAVTFGTRGTQDAVANGDTRTLSLHHSHTGESATVTFKRDGRYDEEALKKLNWLLRDWRREEPTKMDPHLFDVIWEVYRDVGAHEAIEVVCGYRSPATNAMLRARSRGVAQFSQHMLGKAMDFYIPDANLTAIREAGLRLQRGGVGFYPTSGSPFVHLDTGSVRHWPRMSRDQLARVFPDGKTVHLPADGRPLSGYDVAARMIEQRGGAVRGRTILAAARTEPDEEEMTNDGRVVFRSGGGAAPAAASAAATPRRSLFAWLGGDSEDKDEARPAAAPQAETARPAQAAQAAQVPQPAPGVPLPPSRPTGAPMALAAAPATVPVRPYESTISVAEAGAPGAFAEAPRPVMPTQLASSQPDLRWVSGPAGVAPAAQDTTFASRGTPSPNTPLPPARPGREASGGGFELASASSRPANLDVTASVGRGLPAVITNGNEPAADAAPALAYASLEDTAPRALPAPTRVAAASAAAAPRREASPRLTAPRSEGPGLPRLITAVRFANAAVDMRHPDAKTAPALLRGSRGVLDVRFTREPFELAADRFAGPAIQALPIARFEVAALGTPASETAKRTH